MTFETSIGQAQVSVRIDYNGKVRPLYRHEKAHLRLQAELRAREQELTGK